VVIIERRVTEFGEKVDRCRLSTLLWSDHQNLRRVSQSSRSAKTATALLRGRVRIRPDATISTLRPCTASQPPRKPSAKRGALARRSRVGKGRRSSQGAQTASGGAIHASCLPLRHCEFSPTLAGQTARGQCDTAGTTEAQPYMYRLHAPETEWESLHLGMQLTVHGATFFRIEAVVEVTIRCLVQRHWLLFSPSLTLMGMARLTCLS
jgi:hypothetical protein